jgi:ribonuclease HI
MAFRRTTPPTKSATKKRVSRPSLLNGTQEFIGAPVTRAEEAVLVAHVDGGARGNPGPAGYGVVIEDHAGRRIDTLYKYLGTQTNNYAEYSGLLAALEYAVRNGFKALKVYTDSELLAKQVSGEYKVRSAPLQELHAHCKALVRELDQFQIRHIPREDNREADHLANLAMDEAMFGKQAASRPAKGGGKPREITGVVRNGVVQFDGNALPEGARVKIRFEE